VFLFLGMKIAIVGTGYVGLTTGALLADSGNHVTCIDNNGSVVDTLRQGKVHFFEPGLSEIVSKNSKKGNLKFTTDLGEAVRDAEATFVAVGTPSGGGWGI